MALPPDRKSKPQRALIVLGSALATLLLACVVVVVRRRSAMLAEGDPQHGEALSSLADAWRVKRR